MNSTLSTLQDHPFTFQIVAAASRGSGMLSYVAYIISVRTNSQQYKVERRYREFVALRTAILKKWPGFLLPSLPSKHLITSNSFEVVRSRCLHLALFLNRVAQKTNFASSSQFQAFVDPSVKGFESIVQNVEGGSVAQILEKYHEYFSPERQKSLRDSNPQIDSLLSELALPSVQANLMNLHDEMKDLHAVSEEYVKASNSLYEEGLPSLEGIVFHKSVLPRRKGPEPKEDLSSFARISDLLDWEQREVKALLEAVETSKELARQQNYTQRMMASNQERIEQIEANQLSIGFLFGAKNDPAAIRVDNQQLAQRLQMYGQLQQLVALGLRQSGRQFLADRQRRWKGGWHKCAEDQLQKISSEKAFYVQVANDL